MSTAAPLSACIYVSSSEHEDVDVERSMSAPIVVIVDTQMTWYNKHFAASVSSVINYQ